MLAVDQFSADMEAGSKLVNRRVLQTRDYRLLLCVLAVAFLSLLAMADRIDFHADEAIYLSRVPVNLTNDSGLFFSGWYWATSLGSPTPFSARCSSALLGALGVAALTALFLTHFPGKRISLLILLPLMLVVSYQGVFLMVRVRPELSWMCLAVLSMALLGQVNLSDKPIYRVLAVACLLLLPMNHRLSWLACSSIGGYLLLFGWRSYGVAFTWTALAAMPAGALINFGLRPLILGETLTASYLEFVSSPEFPPPRFTFPKFLVNVFWDCSIALRDTAANPSWWDRILPASTRSVISHHFFANLLWAVGCLLPLMGKSMRQRYVLSLPLLLLLVMFATGYFNPTYFAIFSTYSIACFAFLAYQREQATLIRVFCSGCVLLSLVNGTSFLSTRIMNHGRASMFQIEPRLRALVESLPADASVAVPERFQSIAANHTGPRLIIYKDKLPDDIDYVVFDDYDFAMYRKFIPDFDEKQAQIDHALANFELLECTTVPIYWNDQLNPEIESGELASMQSSWFFRNSVQYKITVVGSQRPTPSLASAHEKPLR